jgi:uncharacterized membrane protein YidH (DUF202 family)
VDEAQEVDGRVGRSPARLIVGVILVIIGILAIIAAILYFTEPAHSLPSILGTIKHPPATVHRADSHRTLRAIVALIVGIILLVAGLFTFAWKPRNR